MTPRCLSLSRIVLKYYLNSPLLALISTVKKLLINNVLNKCCKNQCLSLLMHARANPFRNQTMRLSCIYTRAAIYTHNIMFRCVF